MCSNENSNVAKTDLQQYHNSNSVNYSSDQSHHLTNQHSPSPQQQQQQQQSLVTSGPGGPSPQQHSPQLPQSIAPPPPPPPPQQPQQSPQQRSQLSPNLLPSGISMLTVPPGLLTLDHYRLQLYNYAAMAERLRCSQYPGPIPLCPTYPTAAAMGTYGPRLALSMSLFRNHVFQPEEPKPQHSYIGLIAMAILSSPDGKLVLSDIYQHILDNYPYFRSRGPGWRNSIRHNLSLNDCFIKAGRSSNGKGHYWSIHPANLEDFKKGDFRRRKAQQKVRKHMGLAVDDDGTDSPSPPPLPVTPPTNALHGLCPNAWGAATLSASGTVAMYATQSRKRQFDVASLLAPDDEHHHFIKPQSSKRFALSACSAGDIDEDIDVVASDQEDKDETTFLLNRSPSEDHGIDSATDSPPHTAAHQEDDPGHPLTVATSGGGGSTSTGSWHGLMQHWPSGFSHFGVGMDPRIFGRYYGQYMAATQHASRRLNIANTTADLSEIPATLQTNDC